MWVYLLALQRRIASGSLPLEILSAISIQLLVDTTLIYLDLAFQKGFLCLAQVFQIRHLPLIPLHSPRGRFDIGRPMVVLKLYQFSYDLEKTSTCTSSSLFDCRVDL